MAIQTNTSPSALMSITVIAIMLLCGVGVTAVMTVVAAQPMRQTPTPATSNTSGEVTCTECGLIESVLVVSTELGGSIDSLKADIGKSAAWEFDQAGATRATARF